MTMHQAGDAACTLPHLKPNPGPIPYKGNFRNVLEYALDCIDREDAAIETFVVHKADKFVTLYDGFPKSTIHLLVLPRMRLLELSAVNASHLEVLDQLTVYAAWVVAGLSKMFPDLGFTHGIHSVPSLRQLHVHVFSQDFMSPCLKNAKHFNSFQPPFLVALGDVLSCLRSGNEPSAFFKLKDAEERMKKQELQCHRCGACFGRQFASLKKHLGTCTAALPAAPPLLDISQSFLQPLGVKRGGDAAFAEESSGVGSCCESGVQSKRACTDVVDLT